MVNHQTLDCIPTERCLNEYMTSVSDPEFMEAAGLGNQSSLRSGSDYVFNHSDALADTLKASSTVNRFFTLVTRGDFLLRGLHISSISGIVLALVFVLALTMALEVLNHWLHIQQERRKHLTRTRNRTRADNRMQWMITCHRIATMLIGHLVLVCVMTRNIWFLVIVVLGSGIGHFFLKPCVFQRLPNYMKDRRGYLIKMPDEIRYEMKLVPVTRAVDNKDGTQNEDTIDLRKGN